MNTPKAKGGFMPQVFNIENDYIKAKVKFGGIRNCILFRWLPYMTYQKPRIKIKVSSKKTGFDIKSISLNCDDPKARDNPYGLSQINYGWYAKQLNQEGIYQVQLPPLISGGVQYEYFLSVGLKYQHEGQEQELTIQELIMATGNVPYTETIAISVVSAIVGAGLTLLVQLLIRVIN